MTSYLIGVPVMGMAMGNIASSVVSHRYRRKIEEAIKSEPLILSGIELMKYLNRNLSNETKVLSKNDFLIYTLVRLDIIDVNLIAKIYERFDELDIESCGSLSVSHKTYVIRNVDGRNVDGSNEDGSITSDDINTSSSVSKKVSIVSNSIPIFTNSRQSQYDQLNETHNVLISNDFVI